MTLAGRQCFIIVFHLSLPSGNNHSAGIVVSWGNFSHAPVVATEDSDVNAVALIKTTILVVDDPQDLRTACPVHT
jgi:hypothetical protein